MKKSLLWFAVARSPYNDFLFEELSKKFDLEVVYLHQSISTHPWDLQNPSYQYQYIDTRFWKYTKRIFQVDSIVVTGWSDWRFLLLSILIPAKTSKAFWTDTPKTNRNRSVKTLIRHIVIKTIFWKFDQVWSTGTPGCEVLRQLGCPPAKIRSLPFFYDLTKYDETEQSSHKQAAAFRINHTNDNSDCVFLCMGQLATKKRFGDAIQALSGLPTNAALWIAGEGAEQENLKQLALEIGVSERVFFLGWLQPENSRLAFMAADIFVHPAANDPFPTVVLEAMTWGKPVIGTNVAGSVVDRVSHGENGFVYEEGRINQLEEYMAFFLNHPELIEKFHIASRNTAIQHPVEKGIQLVEKLSEY